MPSLTSSISGLSTIRVSEVTQGSGANFRFPAGLSFFGPYLQHWIREILEVEGEVHVSKTADDIVSGVFLYDKFEKTGTICTRSREVFDYFYELRPFNSLYAEINTELPKEIYDIYTIDLEHLDPVHTFNHQISIAEEQSSGELGEFMRLTHPGINGKWVDVALRNGDKCVMIRLGDEVAAVGWISLVNNVGRLYSIYVKPKFRRMGMGLDIVYARLLWLRSRRARTAFSEISPNNIPSSGISLRAGMKPTGQVYEYFKLDRTIGSTSLVARC
jgi:ribosomal protein S18 acetylase RimI-like enzyme